MQKFVALFLGVAVCALVGIGVAAADDDDSKKRQEKPDTIITCEGSFSPGAYGVIAGTAPVSVNAETRSH